MTDWRARHEQHKRVRRHGWRVISNAVRGRQYLPSALELVLALLLAAMMAVAYFSWVSA